MGQDKPPLISLDLETGAYEEIPLPAELEAVAGESDLVLGRGHDGRAWLASANGGFLAPVDGSGVLPQPISPPSEADSGQEDASGLRGIYALWADDTALWIMVRLEVGEVQPGTPLGVGVNDQRFDTRIYAIDEVAGGILGWIEDDRFLLPVWSEDRSLVSHVFEKRDGDTRIAVFGVHLSR